MAKNVKATSDKPMEEKQVQENTETTATEQKSFSTKLTKINDALMPLIERQLTGHGIQMTDYQKQCVLMGIAAINTLLDKEGLTWKSPNFDDRNVTQILQTLAALQLNAAATPREVYFQLRNVSTMGPDSKKIWKKQIEMGIEGDGNDSILRRFGAGVKKVGKFWSVREGDEFEYPKHTGLEVTPPVWKETGKGKVVRIVYPILMEDDSVEFHIAEREDVKRNLAAHISNNLMNETFGICPDRYNATPQQKQEIDKRKRELLSKLDGVSLDDAFNIPELQPYISPAWMELHSRESMIIRKMRNNIVKKIPKDFSNAFIASTYMDATDDTRATIEAEINDDANREAIDVDYADADEDPDAGELIHVDTSTGEVIDIGKEVKMPENASVDQVYQEDEGGQTTLGDIPEHQEQKNVSNKIQTARGPKPY